MVCSLTLSFGYYDVARYCLILKEQKMALSWAEKLLGFDLYWVGEDHPEYKKVLAIEYGTTKALSVPEPSPEQWKVDLRNHVILMLMT